MAGSTAPSDKKLFYSYPCYNDAGEEISHEQWLKDEAVRAEVDVRKLRHEAETHGIPQRFADADLEKCDQKQRAVIAAREWARGNIEAVLIYGKCGRGKTYLAAAAKKELNRRRDITNRDTLFVTESDLIQEIKNTYNDDAKYSELQIYRKYINAKYLIVDDVGVERATVTTLGIWEKIINGRYNVCGRTLLTSNYNTKELYEILGVRVVERIKEGGNVFELVGENRREKQFGVYGECPKTKP